MNGRKYAFIFILLSLSINMPLCAQNHLSKVWVPDNGDGTYHNPVINADYSDPDVCRSGNDYYMTASSFTCVPGLPILHSKDMVNWSIVNHAVQRLIPDSLFDKPQHGKGIWAPSIRVHQGIFYIYFGDPDFGIYMTKTKNPIDTWDPLILVKKGKGLIDACPLFDDDGKVYLVHAYAGSRAGIKSMLAVSRLTQDGTKTLGKTKIVYDGHDLDPTIEGAKFYKRNGYYYIFAPAGGVSTGWQVVLRSKNIFGPYERCVVLAQGNTDINGPHQGAWVETPGGQSWFYHFQDRDAYGRVVYLEPMNWKNDWPVIGIDKNDDGCGEPVITWEKPDIGEVYPIATPAESDEFNSLEQGLQWQWNGNPQPWWAVFNSVKGYIRLYSVPVPNDYHNLWDVSNLLLQKFPATNFTATMKLTLNSGKDSKERTGLIVFGHDYSLLSFEKKDGNFILSQNICKKAEKGTLETVIDKVEIPTSTIFLRVLVHPGAICSFSYSINGKKYSPIGEDFVARPGGWIGAKVGTFCSRMNLTHDGGSAQIDWFRVTK